MEQTAPERNARQRLMQSLLDLGGKAFSPETAKNIQVQVEAQREFEQFIQSTKTLSLIAALNVLIRPGHTPPWLRTKLMEILALIPLRADGVRATLEFVFAVHPSSTVKTSEAATPQKKGANITLEALTMASNLISSSPASVTPEIWYSGISPQLLDLLDGAEGPELIKVVAYIIGFGILGRKVSGAPGTRGWKYLVEPILDAIKPSQARHLDGKSANSEEIIDLSKDKVLVSHRDLATAISRLRSLTSSHPNPGLCKRLLYPLILPLWALSSWPKPQQQINEQICTPALDLLRIYLKLAGSSSSLFTLVYNLGYIGGQNLQKPEWVYKETDKGELQIVETRSAMGSFDGGRLYQISLGDVDQKIPKLVELITEIFSDADIATVFLDLLERWLNSSRAAHKGGNILIKDESEEKDPMASLTEIKVLQAMMEKLPEKLASQPKHILGLVSQVLAGGQEGTNDNDDEVASVALSLLNMIITVPGFQKSKADPEVIRSIETSLGKLAKQQQHSDISQTASNLELLLKYRDELDDPSSTPTTTTAPTARQIEDRKTYSLAISYITQPDSPPPVRSEGLHLLATLITTTSPVLDIPGILVLLSSLMRNTANSEDYTTSQAIKLFTLLATAHPRSVTTELLDHYLDARETEPLDARLRFGEALLQVVERLGETFTGDVARQVGEALLSIAGRRGHRPKTEARQRREERAREKKVREAEKVWGGPVPDLDSLGDDGDEEGGEVLSPEEKAREEIMARIVGGWESKRGAEDVRIRASAVSVLSSAIETNIAGLGPSLLSTAVDLCVSILQIETEAEKGILRRAAVLLVLSFVRALDRAREEGRRLGFGLAAQEDIVRTLGYVRETDGDGLVRQHAGDVIESLENWRVGGLVGGGGGEEVMMGAGAGGLLGAGGGVGLTRLAGLAVDPARAANLAAARGSVGGGGFGAHPRIEEIE